MQVTVTQDVDSNPVFVELSGELDLFSASEVRRALSELIDRGHDELAVDLRNVAFIDSMGLAVLVGALKKARIRHGSLDLICVNGQPQRILKQTGLNKVFQTYPSRQERAGKASRIV